MTTSEVIKKDASPKPMIVRPQMNTDVNYNLAQDNAYLQAYPFVPATPAMQPITDPISRV